jgi:hypothetical protein
MRKLFLSSLITTIITLLFGILQTSAVASYLIGNQATSFVQILQKIFSFIVEPLSNLLYNLINIRSVLIDIRPNFYVMLITMAVVFFIYYTIIFLISKKIAEKNINYMNLAVFVSAISLFLFLFGKFLMIEMVFDGPPMNHGLDLVIVGIGPAILVSVLIERIMGNNLKIISFGRKLDKK